VQCSVGQDHCAQIKKIWPENSRFARDDLV
jgi:hypothetical protein